MHTAAAPRAAGKAAFLDDVTSPQTRMLEKRRQVFEVEEALEAQKEEYARREEAFRRREEGLLKKDLELQETLIRFNQIITENESKRARAEKKVLEEKSATGAKDEEVVGSLGQLAQLREDLAALHAKKVKMEPAFRFLDAFQRAHSEEFHDVNAVLERFQTLRTVRADLQAEQQRAVRLIEGQRRQLARLQKAAATQQLSGENVMTRLKKHLEDTRAAAVALQAGADEVAVHERGRVLELGQVLQSVHNLHARCVASAHGAVLRHTPSDVRVLGYGAEAFGQCDDEEEEEGAGEGDAGSDGGDEVVGASAAAAAGDAGGSGGLGETAAAAAGSAARRGSSGGGAAASAAAAVRGDIALVDPAAVRRRLRQALGLLHVVGSYTVDLQAIAAGGGEWAAEQRRRAAERDAAAAVEAGRVNAAKAAKAAKTAAAAAKAAAAAPFTAAGAVPSEAATASDRLGALLGSAPLPLGVRLAAPPAQGGRLGATMPFPGASGGGVEGSGSGPFISKSGGMVWAVRGALLTQQQVARLQVAPPSATVAAAVAMGATSSSAASAEPAEATAGSGSVVGLGASLASGGSSVLSASKPSRRGPAAAGRSALAGASSPSASSSVSATPGRRR